MRFTTCLALLSLLASANAASAGLQEVCPSTSQVGDNVECYPLHFTSKTEVHPSGIPIIAYLFINTDVPPGTSLPAMVMAHGSGSMYSSGNHNRGLNTKQLQWIRQYTSELGIPTLHVDSFQSRYLLPDTDIAGDPDQRMFDWENPPSPDSMGGDDYRATSTAGGQEEGDAYVNVPFDPDADDWKDQGNGRAGVSEVIERPYDMDAAYDFLVGEITATLRANATGDTLPAGFTPGTTDTIDNLVPGLVINPQVIVQYGTSHGGQTSMGTAYTPRATNADNPMGLGGINNDGRRFAAFFDYYGGCSMYGAFGGVSNSDWQPYAPFVMLHGEEDPIWTDGAAGATVAEQFASAECGQRISKARAQPGFDIFLEAILYKDAEHSFDGIHVNDIGAAGIDDPDYPGWLAKIHSNYQVVVTMIRALEMITAPGSSDTLVDFGFTGSNPWFTTRPYSPTLPPEALFLTRAFAPEPELDIVGSMSTGTLDISAVIGDPFAYHEIHYSLAGAPVEVSINTAGILSYAYSGDSASGLSTQFLVIAESLLGQTLVAVTLQSANGIDGTLTIGETLAASTTTLDAGTLASINMRLDQLLGGTDLLQAETYNVNGLPAGIALAADSVTLQGNIAESALPLEFTVTATLGDLDVSSTIQLSLNDAGHVTASIGGITAAGISDEAIELVLEPINPPLDDGNDDDGDDGNNDDNSNDNNDDSQGDNADDIPSEGNGGKSGGGALLWLIPLLLLRRQAH